MTNEKWQMAVCWFGLLTPICHWSLVIYHLTSLTEAFSEAAGGEDGAHVLGPLECGGIGALCLAHAPLHLLDGLIFVLFHPPAHLLFDETDFLYALSDKHRAKHGHVGACHQHLERVLGPVNAARRSHAGPDTPVENGDPPQREPERLRGAQEHIRPHLQG